MGSVYVSLGCVCVCIVGWVGWRGGKSTKLTADTSDKKKIEENRKLKKKKNSHASCSDTGEGNISPTKQNFTLLDFGCCLPLSEGPVGLERGAFPPK